MIGRVDVSPIPARVFLAEKKRILEAFERRLNIGEIYSGDVQKYGNDPSLKGQIVKGIEDYAHLIQLQLEVMTIRIAMLREGGKLASPERLELSTQEVQRLLTQEARIHTG